MRVSLDGSGRMSDAAVSGMTQGRSRAHGSGGAVLLRALASASLVAATLFGLTSSSVGSAATLPTGFHETVVFSGLTEPSNIRFASDGRVFVAEKSGLIKVFDSLSDTTPDDVRRPADEGLQLLGSRACSAWRSIRTSRRRRTSTSSTRTTTSSAAPHRRRAGARPAPRPIRVRRHPVRPTDGCVSAAGFRASRPRERDDRDRSRCSSRTGASSIRVTRSATSHSGRTARCTRAEATAPASLSPTGVRTDRR